MRYDEPKFLEYQRSGYTASEIAQRFGVTTRTVLRWRVRTGTAGDRAPIRPPSDRRRAEQMLDEGCSFREVAQTLGVSDQTIKRWFPGRGWTKQQSGAWAAFMRRQTVL